MPPPHPRPAFTKDPSGALGLLIPVRVEPCEPPGLLASRVYIDLVVADEPTARRLLLAGVEKAGARRTDVPFPATAIAGAAGREVVARFPPRSERHEEQSTELVRPPGRGTRLDRAPSDSSTNYAQLERQLHEYYGGKVCVVDGDAADKDAIDWIPFDDNVANTSFENLIPIGRRHRLRPMGLRALNRLGEGQFRFDLDLTAENLLYRSRRHFHEGRPALAFGCARLGEALALRYADDLEAQEDDGWAFLCLCLFYLPYRMNQRMLETTLLRVRLWLSAAPACPRARRDALLLSIANLYQDIWAWARAEELYEQVLSGHLAPQTMAATLRRRTIGRFFRAVPERYLDHDFLRVADIKSSTDFLVSLAIARGWWCIVQGRPGECLKVLEPFDFDEDSLGTVTSYSPHNKFELKLTQAAAFQAIGLDCTSQVQLVRQLARAPAFSRYARWCGSAR